MVNLCQRSQEYTMGKRQSSINGVEGENKGKKNPMK